MMSEGEFVPERQRDQVLFSIGDIGVSQYWIVTPNGSAPLADSYWVVRDASRTDEKMPAYAIVLCILLMPLCGLGALFLLIKESRTTGYVEVQVSSERLLHMTQIAISNPEQVAYWRKVVSQAQSLAASS